MSQIARRARTPDPAETVLAGELNAGDLRRPIEFDYVDAERGREIRIHGLLTRIRVDSVGLLLHVEGDPVWPAIEGLEMSLDQQVVLGPHPEVGDR